MLLRNKHLRVTLPMWITKGLTMLSSDVLLRISVFVGIHAGMLLGLFAFS